MSLFDQERPPKLIGRLAVIQNAKSLEIVTFQRILGRGSSANSSGVRNSYLEPLSIGNRHSAIANNIHL